MNFLLRRYNCHIPYHTIPTDVWKSTPTFPVSCEGRKFRKQRNIVWLTSIYQTFSYYQFNAQFFYFSTTYMLHYAQHVSSSTLLIFRRTNCLTTASGIVTLCTQPYSMRVESGLSPLSTCILYGCLQRVTIPEAVVIQWVLLRMSNVLLETCWA